MARNWLGWIFVLVIAGSFITYFGVKYNSTSNPFHRNDLSDFPQALSVQNCSLKSKCNFGDQSNGSRISFQTQHKLNKNGNWTILITVNNAFFDFFRNWYLAYLHLNISYPLVVVAEDGIVYEKLLSFKSKSITIEKVDTNL